MALPTHGRSRNTALQKHGASETWRSRYGSLVRVSDLNAQDQRHARHLIPGGRVGPTGKNATMLPPFIIEQIRRREQQERANREAQRPRVELPIAPLRPAREPSFPSYDEPTDETPDRGVVIIQF